MKKDETYDVNITITPGRPWGWGSSARKEEFEDIVSAWEGWKDRPSSSSLRIGTLGEPTTHPEFADFLELTRSGYFTDGLILSHPKDPRHTDILESTKKYAPWIVLLSPSRNMVEGIRRVYDGGVKIGVIIRSEEEWAQFLEGEWKEDESYLLFPAQTYKPPVDHPVNLSVVEYHQNILLTSPKILITKDSTNLKPIKVYDRL